MFLTAGELSSFPRGEGGEGIPQIEQCSTAQHGPCFPPPEPPSPQGMAPDLELASAGPVL